MSAIKPRKAPLSVAGLPVMTAPATLDKSEPTPRDPNDKIKVGVFVPPAVHKRLREISLERRISLSQIFMAGLDLYLAEMGEPGTAELTGGTRS